jgi:hypothetical protein
MTQVYLYNTTNTLVNQALASNPNAGYSAGQLLQQAFKSMANVNSTMASQFQAGNYKYGVFTDGSFYVNTPSYAEYNYGSFNTTGSNINHIEFASNTISGSYLDVYGTFNYSGLPFISASTYGQISKIVVTTPISPTTNMLDTYTGVLNISANGTISGNITGFQEVIVNKATLIGEGVYYVGNVSASTNEFNPNLTAVSGGNITQFGLIATNFNLPASTNYISDGVYADGTNWSINTPLNQLQLKSGSDTYTLAGTAGQSVNGGFGNDTFTINSPNNTINGQGGVDIAIFSGKSGNYSIQSNSLSTLVNDLSSSSDTNNTLIGFTRLSFSDTNIALDIGPTQTAGSVYMLYQATFNRTPDAPGLGYWINAVDKGANIITNVAASFIQSPEFVAKYGANPSNASYVDNLYQNVLHRAGESGGVAYWNGQLNTGAATKAFVLEQFATLAEGAALVAPAIAHGIAYQQWVG